MLQFTNAYICITHVNQKDQETAGPIIVFSWECKGRIDNGDKICHNPERDGLWNVKGVMSGNDQKTQLRVLERGI